MFNDPPYHTRVRKLLAPAFTPRALRELQARIEVLVERLLEAAAERGEIDLIADFAAAIPIQLIGDMLGIPQGEREPLRGWSLAILGALEPVLSREQFDAGVCAVAEFKDYLSDIIARRQSDANDPAEILSKLIAGTDLTTTDAKGERLSKLELIHNCIFLLNAGHETTTNLIGNGVDLLIRHPDVMSDLRRHPQTIETAVEEFLRMESSNQLGNRRAVKETKRGGVPGRARRRPPRCCWRCPWSRSPRGPTGWTMGWTSCTRSARGPPLRLRCEDDGRGTAAFRAEARHRGEFHFFPFPAHGQTILSRSERRVNKMIDITVSTNTSPSDPPS